MAWPAPLKDAIILYYMIPPPEECLSVLKAREVPEHIVQHSLTVRKVALFLVRALNERGEKLNQGLIEAGSILHDIAKIDGLKAIQSHSRDGALLLRRLGYPEVAEIVRQHVVLDRPPREGWICEASLVHYADKRVRHTEIVSLKDRFRDLKERYGQKPGAMVWLENAEMESLALEECLFRNLPFTPEILNSLSPTE